MLHRLPEYSKRESESESECVIRSKVVVMVVVEVVVRVVEGGEGVSEVVLPTTSDVLYRSAIFGSLDHATVILRHAIELLIFP